MPNNSAGIPRFWKELKRRNVIRSLAIYAGSAFVILEAATIIFPRWDLPDWTIDELVKVFSQLAGMEVINTLKEVYREQGFQPALLAAADNWTRRFETASAQHANMLYAYGGDTEKMIFWLDRMYIRRDPAAPYLGIQPWLRPYADHPRYVEILKRMNLPGGE